MQNSKKDKNMKENVIQNITSGLKSIGRSRKKSDLDAHKEMQTTLVSSTTKENNLIKYMAKELGTSQKTLHKHRIFQLKIDANHEFA